MATAPYRADNAAPDSAHEPSDAGPAVPRVDAEALSEELYESLAPLINKLLWTLLGPDSERDDLAHEIFLRILQNAHQLRDRSRLHAWAARLAVNAVKNEFRRRKLRRWFSLSADDEQTPSYHPDFEGREVLLRTYRVLAQLPERERLPLTLHLVGQHSIEEVAVAIGSSTRTVKRRLQAARARFVRLASSDPLLAERLEHSHVEDDGDA